MFLQYIILATSFKTFLWHAFINVTKLSWLWNKYYKLIDLVTFWLNVMSREIHEPQPQLATIFEWN